MARCVVSATHVTLNESDASGLITGPIFKLHNTHFRCAFYKDQYSQRLFRL